MTDLPDEDDPEEGMSALGCLVLMMGFGACALLLAMGAAVVILALRAKGV